MSHDQRPASAASTAPPHRTVWQRWQHRWIGPRLAREVLDAATLDRLEQLVRESEQHHTGQIRVCVEGALPLSYLQRDASAQERARALFAKLNVWDTEDNNGVLIYLLASERAIEIVVDRALRRLVPDQVWVDAIAEMQTAFRTQQFEAGLRQAVSAVDAQLRQYFPKSVAANNLTAPMDDLPNRPVLI